MALFKWKDLPGLFGRSFKIFMANDPLRLGAATAFFTIFALPPIILIITSVFGIIFNEQIISGQLFSTLKEIIGEESAAQIYSVLENIRHIDENLLITILGFLFLIFIATTLFKVIQSSLNQLWRIKLKKSRNLRSVLKSRLISFVIIISGGVLFIASLLLDSAIAYAKDYMIELVPGLNTFLIQAARRVVTFAILIVWFSIIFKFLSDARLSWKPVKVGAMLTGILFTIGEIILGKLLINSGIGNIYGAAAAIVLFLLFVFYSSFIFYFGATFTMVYAEYCGKNIRPKPYAKTTASTI